MGIVNFIGDMRILLSAMTARAPASDEVGSLALLAQGHADKTPTALALISDDEQITWQGLNERANRIAHRLSKDGVGKGDCISLFMYNRIDFVVSMLGIQKIGAIVGMINTHLGKQQLTHCISLVEAKKCIFGEELLESLNEIRHTLELKDGEDFYCVNDNSDTSPPDWAMALDSKDVGIEHTNLPVTNSITRGDIALYIFTSGTTGLPKAAMVSNKRVLSIGGMSAKMLLRINANDRMYNCLPLYHSTGLIVGLSAAFHARASTVLRRKLSVSAFWDDIRKYDCSCFVYIGEFIRYLMSRPRQKDDGENPIRAVVGNGLRPDIWQSFKDRFNVYRIGEFYGASEGNGGFANMFNKDCTVGLGIAPVKLVAYDIGCDEIVRTADGRCIEVAQGESGLLLIQVTDSSKFEGYTSADESQKKLIKDAFKAGDVYFNSGDLMKTVDVGFAFGRKHYQFIDRIGDTFRWKSENVSTNEVAELINNFDDIISTTVYGVRIPGSDGKAGMAAIVLKEDVHIRSMDMASLSKHVVDSLPSYARPLFIRILKALPTTTTHKLQKNDLRDSAYHLDKVQDDLLVMKPQSHCYCKLDSDYYDQIMHRSVVF